MKNKQNVSSNFVKLSEPNLGYISKSNVDTFSTPNVIFSVSNNNHDLPLIKLNFANHQYNALIDTGANVCLIQSDVLEKIKQHTKVEYLSRSVRLHTLNQVSIPFISVVKLKFRIQTKWFHSVFYVTREPWNCNYDLILSYDFLQANKVTIDTANKQFIYQNTKIKYDENPPKIDTKPHNNKQENNPTINVKVFKTVHIEPNSSALIQLNIPSKVLFNSDILFTPFRNKSNLSISSSLHSPGSSDTFTTMIHNNTSKKVTIRKGHTLGYIEKFNKNEIIHTKNKDAFQINNINLTQINKLRQQELNKEDFNLEHLNNKDKQKILDLLISNYKVFSKTYKTLGCTKEVVPQFKLLHEFPIQTKPYPIPNIAKQFAVKEISDLLEAGIIEPTNSNYAFPVLFVKKKPLPGEKDLKFPMVIDYRLLNSITESFKICLPKISDIIHTIAGRNLYCVLDLKSAFFQIYLPESDRSKLAFCSELGNFQPCRMPFGGRNSTSYFHTLIHKCLGDLKGKNLQFFLDDIILAADSLEELLPILQAVFDRLSKFNLTLDPAKLQLCKKEITYLGFTLNANGYSPSEQNISKVLKFPIPKNVKEIQMFLGMTNYFRHLIFDYAKLIAPIVKLTRKNTPFVWSSECQEAFLKLQETILLKPTLKNIDFDKEMYLVTDASKISMCGILLQKQDNNYYPIEFFSRTLTPAESRYPSIRRELLAIFASVRHFHEYLYGKKFTILTDAKALTYHIHLDKQPDIVARWLLYLQQFEYLTEHIPGFKNPADFLSRVGHDSQQIINTNVNAAHINNIHLFQNNTDLSPQNICSQQQQDMEIMNLINKVKNKDKQASKLFFIDNETNLLMKKHAKRNKKSRYTSLKRIVLPKALANEVIKIAHAPHFGVKKTYDFINEKYYWKKMFFDIKNFVNSCPNCMQSKPKPVLTKTTMISKANYAPGEFISMDIVGKLPRSLDGKFYILTIIDHYSRYLDTFSLTNFTSSTIIKCLEIYFSRFGIPKIILTDNHKNFNSEEIKQFFKVHNIKQRNSSIYYPQSNAVVERVHRILKESITSMCNKSFEWSKLLIFFKLHYNNSKHSVTGFTPAELFFGRNLNLPLNVYDNPNIVDDPSVYLKKKKKHYELAKKLVQEYESAYFKTHEKYVKGRVVPDFNLTDIVFMRDPIYTKTFQPKFIGPYEILRKLKNNNYVIQHMEDKKSTKVHVSKLYKLNSQNVQNEAVDEKENPNEEKI